MDRDFIAINYLSIRSVYCAAIRLVVIITIMIIHGLFSVSSSPRILIGSDCVRSVTRWHNRSSIVLLNYDLILVF